jgi:hypothetical protein
MTLLIKDNKSILFLHIPKCGGTSVVEMFASSGYSPQLQMRGLPPQASLVTSPQHLTCSTLKSLLRFENLADTFVLTRNPYQRLISEFNWHFRCIPVSNRPDFSDWAIESMARAVEDPFYRDSHFRPAIDFLDADIAARVFRLEDGIEFIAEYFLRMPGKTVPLRVERKNDARSFAQSVCDVKFSDEALATVNSFYRYDFMAFDYEVICPVNVSRDQPSANRLKLDDLLVAKAAVVSRWREETLLELERRIIARIGTCGFSGRESTRNYARVKLADDIANWCQEVALNGEAVGLSSSASFVHTDSFAHNSKAEKRVLASPGLVRELLNLAKSLEEALALCVES